MNVLGDGIIIVMSCMYEIATLGDEIMYHTYTLSA